MTNLIFKAHKKVIKQKGSKYFLLLNFIYFFPLFLCITISAVYYKKAKKGFKKACKMYQDLSEGEKNKKCQ